jgi:DNA mismatch repair protein MSH2
LEYFEFLDTEQYSELDSFLNQLGKVILYLPDDLENVKNSEYRKINNVLNGKDIEVIFVKKTLYSKSSETLANIAKLVGKVTHAVNTIETEAPVAFECVNCMMTVKRLMHDDNNYGLFDLKVGNTNCFMKLDSAALDALNVLKKHDDASQFCSLFGMLNRCKTKMGARLLERFFSVIICSK